MNNLLRAIIVVMTLLLFSCRHKELSSDNVLIANVKVVFDWKNSPEANVETMRMYLFPVDGGNPIPYEFADVKGGKIKVPAGRYKALCINSDTEALLYRNIGGYHTFELYSPEGSMNMAAYSVLHPDKAREERIRCSPDNFYADRIEEALLEVTEEEQTIVFYPANPVCHYTVEVRNVSNLKYVSPGFVTGALSGMSEGLFLGRNRIKSEPATIPFEMSSDGVSTLYADFLTFGQYESQNIHKIVIQVVMPDGNDKGYLFDVTDQVHQAPDPRNVHIILDGLPLPKHIVNGGGFLPSVDEWDNIEVDLPMK